MKTNVALAAYVYANSAYLVADLATITLASQTLRLTTGNTDLVQGGQTYSCGLGALNPSDTRTAIGSEVTSLQLVVAAQGVLLADGHTINEAASIGLFDGCAVSVKRVYMPTWGDTSLGTVDVFSGWVSKVTVDATELRLSVDSPMTKLRRTKLPLRVFQPSCPYTLGDSQCGVTLATFTTTGTAAAGATSTQVALAGVTQPADRFKGGLVTIISGPMAGLKRVCSSSSQVGSNHLLAFSPALPSVPTAGISISATLGDDKTRATCRTRFANLAHFGGFADQPQRKTP